MRAWGFPVGLLVLVTGSLVAQEESAPPSGDDALFNGKDFAGWIADPEALAHWSVRDGLLVADGKGANLVSERHYRDAEIIVEWRAPAGSSGGIWLRGRPKVAILDPAMNDEGSGGLINNQAGASKPTAKADKPAGEWNTFKIEAVGQQVTVYLNDQLVVDKVLMENAFDRSRRIPINGKIELEATGPLEFRQVRVRPIESTP